MPSQDSAAWRLKEIYHSRAQPPGKAIPGKARWKKDNAEGGQAEGGQAESEINPEQKKSPLFCRQ